MKGEAPFQQNDCVCHLVRAYHVVLTTLPKALQTCTIYDLDKARGTRDRASRSNIPGTLAQTIAAAAPGCAVATDWTCIGSCLTATSDGVL